MSKQNQRIFFIAVCVSVPITTALRMSTAPSHIIDDINDNAVAMYQSFNRQDGSALGICNEATGSTKTFVQIVAYHKMGTYLHALGSACLARFYERHGGTTQLYARGDCHCQGQGNEQQLHCEQIIKEPSRIRDDVSRISKKVVHFTREPFDWLLSNYLYHKRGDETIAECLTLMREPGNVQKMQTIFPDAQNIPHNVTTYTELLQNVNEESGLAYEMLRLDLGCVGSFKELVQESDAGKDPHAKSYCLEDFMKGNAQFLASWHDMLDFIDGSVADDECDKCLKKLDPTLNAVKHGTQNNVTSIEKSRLRSIAEQLDEKYFGLKYATAAKHIGCESLSR